MVTNNYDYLPTCGIIFYFFLVCETPTVVHLIQSQKKNMAGVLTLSLLTHG